MNTFKLTGPDYRTRQMAKSLGKQRVFFIRGDRNTLWCKSGDHNWIQKLCSDFGLKYNSISDFELPNYETSKCGTNVLHKIHHERMCNSCRSLNGLPPKTKQKISKTTAKKEENLQTSVVPSQTFEELTSSLREKYAQAMEIAVRYDEALTAVSRLEETQRQLSELQQRVDADLKTLGVYFQQNYVQ
jgi:hypothetical protein